MKQRCLNKRSTAYKYYGGRGITVCRAWLVFTGFQKWAVESGYRDDLTLDRKKNDKGYKPSNCRWVRQSVQVINKRNVKGRTSRFVGVYKAGNRWVARIGAGGTDHYLGRFDSEKEAAEARDAAARKLHGEFARLNFPRKIAA